MTPPAQAVGVAGFRSIAAVGKSMELALNAAYTVAQPISSTDQTKAALIQTDDLEGDGPAGIVRPALSILLYRVDFNKTSRANWSAIGSDEGRAYLPLDLHYLLTAWGDNAEHEHRIIGRTMQVFEQLGALSGPLLHPDGEWEPGEVVQLYLEDLATDDLMRTFDSLRVDFRLSIPYIARTVILAGTEADPVPPVTTVVEDVRPGLGAPL